MRISLRSSLIAITIAAATLAAYRVGYDRAAERYFMHPATGNFAENGVSARIRLIAADTLEPVGGAEFQTILIGSDGGDGGFQRYRSDQNGLLVTDQYMWPGRYQINIRPPGTSRYKVTEYADQETYLVVRDDGSYSPTEFKVRVK